MLEGMTGGALVQPLCESAELTLSLGGCWDVRATSLMAAPLVQCSRLEIIG